MNILLTGGAGYIGSHTAVELLSEGHEVIIIDDCSNSSHSVIERIESITGKTIPFYKADVRDSAVLEEVFTSHTIDGVIHFAGLKAVGESVEKPLLYYQTNLDTTMVLLETMRRHNVTKIVFSSSATVYGTPSLLPITEDSQTGLGITNAYGWTKWMNEQILMDFQAANTDVSVSILRYFNPVGAHESGLIGENPKGTPNNLLPFVAQVASGVREKVVVFGDDYPTPDGTGVRDYIHVVDLARGHLAALNALEPGVSVYNLGTGTGTSVLEMIHAFEEACGHQIPYEIAGRRPGDVAACYASAEKAFAELDWRAEKSIEDACIDTWRWQQTISH